MDSYGRIIIAVVIGFSSTVICCLPSLKKRQSMRTAEEKLKLINEALHQAEERVLRFQERHDRLLTQICSYYLCHKELEEAVVSARKAVDEELEFAAALRKMQLWILSSFPDNVDLANFLA